MFADKGTNVPVLNLVFKSEFRSASALTLSPSRAAHSAPISIISSVAVAAS